MAVLTGCGSDYASLPIYSKSGQLQAVIAVPAGSGHEMEYDQESRSFVPRLQAGSARVVDFLPYPGNFGFIPSTFVEAGDTGEGHALEVLVIAESVPTGTVMEVTPVAALVLDQAGQIDHKIIAVPAKPSEQIITATDYASFTQEYPAAKDIIQKWFVHHNPQQEARFMSWKDEKFAEEQINRSMK